MQRVIVVGLGPIGVAVARAVRAQRDVRLVGLVDNDPGKHGKLLDDLISTPTTGQEPAGPDQITSLRVVTTIDEALAAAGGAGGADVAAVTTTSRFDAMAGTVRQCLGHGLHVVSTCEQMSWPRYRHAELADALDAEAAAAGVTLLGTGVNPGFVMDTLAVVLAGMVRRVTKVRCVRRVDASVRRGPLQQKIGATMSVERFKSLAAEGKMGHQGLAESVAMLAAGLGHCVEPGGVSETLEPVTTDQPRPSALGLIEPGRVAGIHNVATWTSPSGGLTIELDLSMVVGLPDPFDKVRIEGPVSLMMKIPGSIPGDSATVASVINQIPNLPRVRPGLRTMLDMPPAGCANVDAE